jgi:hypothetical protein
VGAEDTLLIDTPGFRHFVLQKITEEDDNPLLLMSIAVKPLSAPPFPLNNIASL